MVRAKSARFRSGGQPILFGRQLTGDSRLPTADSTQQKNAAPSLIALRCDEKQRGIRFRLYAPLEECNTRKVLPPFAQISTSTSCPFGMLVNAF